MSKKANVKQIGIFAVVALALLVGAIVIIGSGKLFTPHLYYALYFDETLDGLSDGSPVTYKGVQLGQVKDIRIYFKPDDKTLHSIVIIELDQDQIVRLDNGKKLVTDEEEIKPFITKQGLKARLKLLSFITGQLSVILDFYPEVPTVWHNYLKPYQEIPTVPTELFQIMKFLNEMPLKELSMKMIKTVEKVETFLNSDKAKESLDTLIDTGKQAHDLVKKLNESYYPLIAEIKSTTEAARKTLNQAEKTLALKDGVPGEIASQVKNTIEQAKTTLSKVDENLDNIKRMTEDNKDISFQVQSTLKEFSKIARSVKELTDYLEQHPEALIKGKKEPQGETK